MTRSSRIRLPRRTVGPGVLGWQTILVRCVSWLLVAIVGIVAVAAFASAATGSRLLVVEGGSMRPALQPGDLIVVRPSSRAALRPGDIISYGSRTGPSTVTHRITHRRGRGPSLRVTTKGDANARPDDGRAGGASIQGKVVAVVPKVGVGVRLLRTPAGFALGIILPAMLLAVGEARRIRREMSRFAR